MKFKPSLIAIISIIVVLVFSFYWFELWVAQIRKNCFEKITTTGLKGFEAQDYNIALKFCLYKYGIKE